MVLSRFLELILMRVRRQKTVVLHVSTYALLNSFLEDSYLSTFLMGADHLVPCLSEVRVGPCEHICFTLSSPGLQ